LLSEHKDVFTQIWCFEHGGKDTALYVDILRNKRKCWS